MLLHLGGVYICLSFIECRCRLVLFLGVLFLLWIILFFGVYIEHVFNTETFQGPGECTTCFFSNYDAPDRVSHEEICEAAEKLTGFNSIAGCQRIGAVWRLHGCTLATRAKLAGQNLLIRNKSVHLYSQNPLSVRDEQGNEIASTRLSIDEIPVYISNEDIQGCLEQAGVKFRSSLILDKVRKADGSMSPRWFTGRRFAWIDLPTVPLPKKFKIGDKLAVLFYREQPKPKLICFSCRLEGHRRGDSVCKGPRSGTSGSTGLPPWRAPARPTSIESTLAVSSDEEEGSVSETDADASSEQEDALEVESEVNEDDIITDDLNENDKTIIRSDSGPGLEQAEERDAVSQERDDVSLGFVQGNLSPPVEVRQHSIGTSDNSGDAVSSVVTSVDVSAMEKEEGDMVPSQDETINKSRTPKSTQDKKKTRVSRKTKKGKNKSSGEISPEELSSETQVTMLVERASRQRQSTLSGFISPSTERSQSLKRQDYYGKLWGKSGEFRLAYQSHIF